MVDTDSRLTGIIRSQIAREMFGLNIPASSLGGAFNLFIDLPRLGGPRPTNAQVDAWNRRFNELNSNRINTKVVSPGQNSRIIGINDPTFKVAVEIQPGTEDKFDVVKPVEESVIDSLPTHNDTTSRKRENVIANASNATSPAGAGNSGAIGLGIAAILLLGGLS